MRILAWQPVKKLALPTPRPVLNAIVDFYRFRFDVGS